MIRLRGLLIAALTVSVSAFALEPGDKLDRTGSSLGINWSRYEGKVVYVDFWASWCPPCLASFPWMEGMQRKYGSSGFAVLAVGLDENQANGAQFLKRAQVSFDTIPDPDGVVAKGMGAKVLPWSLLVAPDGTVLGVLPGFLEHQKAGREDAIRKALAIKRVQR